MQVVFDKLVGYPTCSTNLINITHGRIKYSINYRIENSENSIPDLYRQEQLTLINKASFLGNSKPVELPSVIMKNPEEQVNLSSDVDFIEFLNEQEDIKLKNGKVITVKRRFEKSLERIIQFENLLEMKNKQVKETLTSLPVVESSSPVVDINNVEQNLVHNNPIVESMTKENNEAITGEIITSNNIEVHLEKSDEVFTQDLLTKEEDISISKEEEIKYQKAVAFVHSIVNKFVESEMESEDETFYDYNKFKKEYDFENLDKRIEDSITLQFMSYCK
jgi:hypothetical protein